MTEIRADQFTMWLIDAHLEINLLGDLLEAALIHALCLPVPRFEVGVDDLQFAFAFRTAQRQHSTDDARRAL